MKGPKYMVSEINTNVEQNAKGQIDTWRHFFKSPSFVLWWMGSLMLALFVSWGITVFLAWSEKRDGIVLNDWLLARLPMIDLSHILCTATWSGVALGVIFSLRSPYRSLRLFWVSILIGILRILTIYMVPLDPPVGIVPLRDIFLEHSYYSGEVLVKDLFFSGHVSSLIIAALITDVLWARRLIFGLCIAVGVMLLIQHAHYTVDVLVAPFFGYFSYWLATKISDWIANQHYRHNISS